MCVCVCVCVLRMLKGLLLKLSAHGGQRVPSRRLRKGRGMDQGIKREDEGLL